MRVLFSSVPELGHLYPMLGLARALADAGHDVGFAVSPELAPRAGQGGFETILVGQELADWVAETARRVGGEPGAGLAPDEILPWFLPHLFAEVGAPSTLPDLVQAVSTWRPDLLIHDTYQFAGPIAAATVGVPNVQHTLGPLPPLDALALASDALGPLWGQHGLDPRPLGGAFDWLCLAICPPSLERELPVDVAARLQSVRPVGYDGGQASEPPDWLEQLPDRPLVYGTLGTYLNTDRAVFRAMLDGLAGEDIDLVVTVGAGQDPTSVGPIPPNARVESYIPQSHLLGRCALVVSHGGSGTILPALAGGIPLLVLPQGADNFINAERCTEAGVGLTLQPGEVSAAAVQRATQTLLDEPRFRKRSLEVADEIANLPGSTELVDGLEALQGTPRR